MSFVEKYNYMASSRVNLDRDKYLHFIYFIPFSLWLLNVFFFYVSQTFFTSVLLTFSPKGGLPKLLN